MTRLWVVEKKVGRRKWRYYVSTPVRYEALHLVGVQSASQSNVKFRVVEYVRRKK